MTVSSVELNYNSYIGNGVQDTFAYTFRLDDDNWLKVTVNDADSTDWTHDSVANTITFLPGNAPVVNAIVVLYSSIPLTQLVNYTEYGPFPAEASESALDKLTLIIQQLFGDNSDLSRSLKYPIGDIANSIIPNVNNRSGKYLSFDVDGNVIVADGTTPTDDFVTWKNTWSIGVYNKSDMVLDSGWTMIANKTTTERAAPQPVGYDYNIYDGTLTSTNVLAKQIIIGQRYTPNDKSQLISGYRIYTHAGQQYNVRTIKDPLGTPIVNQVGTFTAANTGWVSFNVDPVFLNVGETVDLVIVMNEPDLTPTTFTGDWNYRTPNNAGVPSAGEISHANKLPASLRVNKTDDSSADRSAELEALSFGDKISYSDQEWIIQTIVDNGTWIDFGITPTVQGNTMGVFEFTFETVSQTPIDYGIDSGHWSAETAISGLFGADVTYPSIIPDDNQYIIDILVQDYTTPVDWDLVASSEGIFSSANQPGIFVVWKGEWLPGTYDKFDMVIDQGWTMIANKETSDLSAPHVDGVPAYSLPDVPIWTDDNYADICYTGTKLHTISKVVITGLRAWVPVYEPNIRYTAYLINDTDPGNPIILESVNIDQLATAVGWVPFNFNSNIIDSNIDITILLITRRYIPELPWTWQWTNRNLSTPAAGEYSLSLSTTFLYINQLDDTGTNRDTDISSLVFGDEITISEDGTASRYSVFRVISPPVLNSDIWSIEVIKISFGGDIRNNRLCNVNAVPTTTVADSPYSYITDYWISNPPSPIVSSINGFIDNKYPADTFNDNGYGIDIKFAPFIQSADWDIVSSSGASISQSGAESFLELNDVYSTDYTDNAGLSPVVNETEDGLEFIDSFLKLTTNELQQVISDVNLLNTLKIGGALPTLYRMSIQSTGTQTYMEILNDGGANQGVFFGVNGNKFELWNYQGGDIDFYTAEAPQLGTRRFIIKDNGTLKATTPNYKSLVLVDSDIPNKKYVDDLVAPLLARIASLEAQVAALTP